MAKHLDRLRAAATSVAERLTHAVGLAAALTDASSLAILERGLTSGWLTRPLSEVADVNPSPDRLDEDEPISFVPMAAVEARTGTIANAERRRAGEVRSGFKQFKRDDVIFARITPCMQNGKTAIFRDDNRYGYGSTEFHVVRPGPELTAEWLHRIMRTKEFRTLAAERFTGTAGQQRVPADFLRSVPIPVPSIVEQSQGLAQMDQSAQASLLLADKRARSKALLNAVMPAALNEAFADLS